MLTTSANSTRTGQAKLLGVSDRVMKAAHDTQAVELRRRIREMKKKQNEKKPKTTKKQSGSGRRSTGPGWRVVAPTRRSARVYARVNRGRVGAGLEFLEEDKAGGWEDAEDSD